MNKDLMIKAGFGPEVEKVENGFCPLCGEEVNFEDFRSEIDRKEFRISGLCQKCMDYMFTCERRD